MNNFIIIALLAFAIFDCSERAVASAGSSELQLTNGRYRRLLVFLEEESVAERPMKQLGVDPKQPNRRSTGQIILLSDGQEGCSFQLDQVIDALSNTSLEVVSIRYGDQADARMSRLAEVTGGRQFFGEAASTGAADGLAAAGLRLSLGSTTAGLAVAERTITLVTQEIQPNFQARLEIRIDDSIRRDLAFVLSFPAQPSQASSLRLMVRSPCGRTFNCTGGNDGVCSVDAASGSLTIRIPDAAIEVGLWTIENMLGTVRQSASTFKSGLIVVTGKGTPSGSDTKQKPITLRGWVIPSKIPIVTKTTQIGVYARLEQGHSLVHGGLVFATVRSNDRLVARFNLSDNGAGADLLANDGTYSGLVPAAAVRTARDYSVSLISTHPVSRVTSAGKLTVEGNNVLFDERLTRPNRIFDLNFHEINLSTKTMLLSWSPVKDPSGLLASGAVVPSYTIRYAPKSEDLLTNFSSSMQLLTNTESSANVFNQIASLGLVQVFLAVAAVSAANITGPVSNLISVDDPNLKPSEDEIKRIGVNVTTAADGNEDRGRGSPTNQNASAIVLSIVAILLAASMLIGGFF